jgi:hypothetical protein
VFPEVSVIHAAWVEAVHAHSRATATFIVPLPPAGSKEDEELVTDAWHRVLVGEVAVAMLVLAELPQAAIKSGRTTTMAPCRSDRTRCTPRRDARFSPALPQLFSVPGWSRVRSRESPNRAILRLRPVLENLEVLRAKGFGIRGLADFRDHD